MRICQVNPYVFPEPYTRQRIGSTNAGRVMEPSFRETPKFRQLPEVNQFRDVRLVTSSRFDLSQFDRAHSHAVPASLRTHHAAITKSACDLICNTSSWGNFLFVRTVRCFAENTSRLPTVYNSNCSPYSAFRSPQAPRAYFVSSIQQSCRVGRCGTPPTY